ncbi:MAG: hypothetical protein KKC68_08345 [Candidatus Thermoplasmatota archaeon]|nr:hypothetical protein [Candidatus Thermoplasmatota archaeon]MBU1941769.1 hypothetical protein [Candidatus Thermoplasmatota archaeon]
MGGKPTTIHYLIILLAIIVTMVIYAKYMNYATQTFTIQITYENQSTLTIDHVTETTGEHTLTTAGGLYRSSTLEPNHYTNITIYATGDSFTLILSIYNNQNIKQNLNPDGTFNQHHALKTFHFTDKVQAAGDTYTYIVTIHDAQNITAIKV